MIERCHPPHSFAATWEFGGYLSWIEVRLSAEADGRTRLQLEHVGMVADAQWAEFGPGAVGVGWDMGLLGLATHLSNGASLNPQEVAAWVASAEGRQFTSLSSQSWAAASIAARPWLTRPQMSRRFSTVIYLPCAAQVSASLKASSVAHLFMSGSTRGSVW